MQPKKRILIIDDDEEFRTVLQELLIRKGYQVDGANDGSIAFVKLGTEKFDLVLTDISMPEISGLQLFSALRAIHNPIDFIVITGNDSQHNREEASRLGAQEYLVKPFDFYQLLALIRKTVSTPAGEVSS